MNIINKKILTIPNYSTLKEFIGKSIEIKYIDTKLNGYDFTYEQDKICNNDCCVITMVNRLIEITFNSKIKEWLDNETILLENGSTKKIQRIII